MQPILFSLGSFHIYSLAIAIILAWLIFSFLFWVSLRNQAIVDDRIFDLTFYPTITAFIGARAGFVLFHRELFLDSLLKIATIWVQPGLSLYGGLIFGLFTMFYLARKYKIRASYCLDGLAASLPAALIIGLVGSLLDGSSIGKLTGNSWGILYVGTVGRRHPVQLYEGISLLLIIFLLLIINRKVTKQGLPYGITGLWFFIFFTIFMFFIEFFKDSSVYFSQLSANQWILIAIFAESVGALYVRRGGREILSQKFINLKDRGAHTLALIYEKFSKRHP